MKKYLIAFLLSMFIVIISCTEATKIVPSSVKEDNFISVDEAKKIVAEHLYYSDWWNQHFILDSPEFDERVYELSWGEPVLVRGLPDGKFHKEEFYYYVLTGVLPDGKILAAITLNAETGELMCGQKWVDPEDNTLRLISSSESVAYAKKEIVYDEKSNVTVRPVYLYGFHQDHYIQSWKYMVEVKNESTDKKGAATGDYVLIDPFVRDFRNDNTLSKNNAAYHPFRASRWSRIPNEFLPPTKAVGDNSGIELVPLE